MRIFRPGGGIGNNQTPTWLENVLRSIERGLQERWPRPFRLWCAATADLPAADDDKMGAGPGALAWDTTLEAPVWSNGTAWTAAEGSIAAGTTSEYWRGDKSWQTLDKAAVGLGSVDNTSDADKPVSTAQQAALDAKIDDTEKGAANGVATLNAASQVPFSQIPLVALTDVYEVASEAAQLGLVVEQGDVAVRSDLNRSYMHNGGSAGTMADWTELKTPTDTVLSVNGYTGAVALTAADVGAQASDATLTAVAASGIEGVWTEVAAAVSPGSGSFTSASGAVRYMKVGRTVIFEATVTITTNGPGATNVNIELPFASRSVAITRRLMFAGGEHQAVGFQCVAYLFNGSTNLRILKYDATYPGGDGYVINIGGTYEAAA